MRVSYRGLLRDGEAVKLEPRVPGLLLYLALVDGRVVSREELMREVWKAHVVDDAACRAFSLLRTALDGDPGAPAPSATPTNTPAPKAP